MKNLKILTKINSIILISLSLNTFHINAAVNEQEINNKQTNNTEIKNENVNENQKKETAKKSKDDYKNLFIAVAILGGLFVEEIIRNKIIGYNDIKIEETTFKDLLYVLGLPLLALFVLGLITCPYGDNNGSPSTYYYFPIYPTNFNRRTYYNV